MLDMSVALVILAGVTMVLGPLVLGAVVFMRRARLRRIVDEAGLTDMAVVYGDGKLQGPAGAGSRTHSIGWAISEMLARLGPFSH